MIRICVHGDRSAEGTTILTYIIAELLRREPNITVEEVSTIMPNNDGICVDEQGIPHAKARINKLAGKIHKPKERATRPAAPMAVTIYDIDD